MDDREIYEISDRILSAITNDLNEEHYSAIKGSLKLAWGMKGIFNASAESANDIKSPPKHKIVIQDELARQIYRDAEDYCNFADNELKEERFQNLLTTWKAAPGLPSDLSKDDCCYIMFVGAITWVYFHELGHLMQEHGYILKTSGASSNTLIQECSANFSSESESQFAALFHVTELSADFEAMTWCILEIIRQFPEDKLRSVICMLVSGISCVFFRFNIGNSLTPDNVLTGSHPHPIIRMELNLSQLFEMLDMMSNPIKLNLNREAIVSLYSGTSYSGTIFWLWKYGIPENFENGFLVEGSFNRTELADYYRTIIGTWDNIEPTIAQLRRFGSPLGVLRFSDEFRQKLAMQSHS
tara:strand:+ start:26078 stop:27142 length:1065 start_codon:yes stop_codon:yes gene_type:complete